MRMMGTLPVRRLVVEAARMIRHGDDDARRQSHPLLHMYISIC